MAIKKELLKKIIMQLKKSGAIPNLKKGKVDSIDLYVYSLDMAQRCVEASEGKLSDVSSLATAISMVVDEVLNDNVFELKELEGFDPTKMNVTLCLN